jgi:hypothetical protein
MATISGALAIAIRHHQAGRLQAAEQIYRQILQAEPNQADAIHLLGIAWQGNPTYRNDRDRSIPASCFERLARPSGVRLLSLQKHAGAEQSQEVAEWFPVLDLGSRLDETWGAFMDTAAVMMNLGVTGAKGRAQ